MAELVANSILKRLREWGLHRIYGYPGDGINAFLDALDRAKGDPGIIQPRHEEMAAFMACGHAKFSAPDTLGVCMATSGPGAIHLLNGLYDAKLDHQPVVAIVGCHCGDLAAAEPAVAPLTSIAQPLAQMVAPIPYPALQGMMDEGAPHGLLGYWRTEYLGELGDEAIDVLVENDLITAPGAYGVKADEVGALAKAGAH